MMKRTTENNFENFFDNICKVTEKLDQESLNKVIETLLGAREKGKTIFFAGNGGSASIASHFAADLGKNTAKKGKKRFRTHSLSDNIAWITAAANDLSYEYVFVEQMKSLAKKGDVLFVISGSGNSKNIVEAAKWAKANGLKTVGLLGFDGGKVKRYLDSKVIIHSDSYEVVESVHNAIQHYIISNIKSTQ